MRLKLGYLPVGLAALALAWVAAPALSSQPYMPGAVDFEQPLAGVHPSGDLATAKRVRSNARAGRGPVSFRSAVIAAPERFDLAGLARERRPYEIRARDSGGDWSEWVEADDGNPVYFGGADVIQLRTRGFRPAGTLHYVNVSGTTSTAEGLLTGAREAINSAFISATAVLDPSAAALPTRPTIVTRAQWGADLETGGCPPRVRASYGTVKAGVIHHTVTANDYGEEEAPGIVLGICRYHRNANGWNDIGYNALVDRFGNLYTGRAGGLKKAVIGAQAQGFNSQTTAIASIGTHTKLAPTSAAVTSIVDYLAWKLAVHGLNATGKTTIVSAGGDLSRYPAGRRVRLNRVFGHGTVGLTACPGEVLNAMIPQIRRRIQARIDEFGGVTPPPDETPPGGGVTPK
ncbi:MAG: N-acetylmuramoyl-L-alanine amidase [Vicinamibacteria bacterium]